MVIAALAFIFGLGGRLAESGAGSGASLSGQVADGKGPVADAHVLVQGTTIKVKTDTAGRFLLTGLPEGRPMRISIWKEGYYSALSEEVTEPAGNISIKMITYPLTDNLRYEWLSPEGKNGCVQCHPALTKMSLKDLHQNSARNPRFLTMYRGTDVEGKQSPPTRYDWGGGIWKTAQVPQKPDLSQAYYGPGYVLDFPGTTGDCSACHIPGASIPFNIDPQAARGADLYGVHCDFCHKVANVFVDPKTGMPNRQRPGVHSMDVRRPSAKDGMRSQLFFGTFTDVNAAQNNANLPLLRESRYCASCHFGVFWNTVVYNSYGEWLKSPYSDPQSGKAKTCQACHMPSPAVHQGKTITNIAPGKGGIERNPSAIHSHDMTVNEYLLRNSLSMSASAKKLNGRALVEVKIVNDKTGHHVPSDSPLRHLILLVEARDEKGNLLRQESGPVLPQWCGDRKNIKGHYAGLPGKAYAKLLKEKWTDVFPTAAYWNHTELVSDNRIAAFAQDSTAFEFIPLKSGKSVITVSLLYRRAFIELMEQKKWNVPDILMAQKKIIVTQR